MSEVERWQRNMRTNFITVRLFSETDPGNEDIAGLSSENESR